MYVTIFLTNIFVRVSEIGRDFVAIKRSLKTLRETNVVKSFLIYKEIFRALEPHFNVFRSEFIQGSQKILPEKRCVIESQSNLTRLIEQHQSRVFARLALSF